MKLRMLILFGMAGIPQFSAFAASYHYNQLKPASISYQDASFSCVTDGNLVRVGIYAEVGDDGRTLSAKLFCRRNRIDCGEYSLVPSDLSFRVEDGEGVIVYLDAFKLRLEGINWMLHHLSTYDERPASELCDEAPILNKVSSFGVDFIPLNFGHGLSSPPARAHGETQDGQSYELDILLGY